LLAQRCQRLGVTFALNLTTPHPDSKEKALQRLCLEFPNWADKIEPRLPFVRAAEQQEYELADIIHVACSFTKQTLVETGVSESKIWLNTYGVDFETFHERDFRKNGPIRFVYVGAVNGNKGAPLLFQAWERLSSTGAELWMIGRVSERVAQLIPNLKGLRLLGATPHREIPGLLRQCDVFVFPSYFEGFGLVLLEAMASGLAVITTTATAGPDLIEGGRGGWIIPPGDVGGLVSIMESCIAEPELVRNAGKDARRIAERHSWKDYVARLIANIGETVVRKRQ
jgi:glycosyltransferase involved in cell wall biosynthesis